MPTCLAEISTKVTADNPNFQAPAITGRKAATDSPPQAQAQTGRPNPQVRADLALPSQSLLIPLVVYDKGASQQEGQK